MQIVRLQRDLIYEILSLDTSGLLCCSRTWCSHLKTAAIEYAVFFVSCDANILLWISIVSHGRENSNADFISCAVHAFTGNDDINHFNHSDPRTDYFIYTDSQIYTERIS
jgi:hypothetical protein